MLALGSAKAPELFGRPSWARSDGVRAFNREALYLTGVPDMRSMWSIEVASSHSHTTRLSLRRVSLIGERRFRCKCHAGKGALKASSTQILHER